METTVAMAVLAVLVAGMGSAIVIAARAMDSSDTPTQRRTDTADAADQILSDMTLARAFTNIASNDVTFIVPDRDMPPDGVDDVIHLSWSGVAGNPLMCDINGNASFILAEDVHHFALNHQTRTIPAEVTGSASIDPNSWGYYQFGAETALNVLFVSGGSWTWLPLLGQFIATPTAQEQLRINKLEEWGHTVEVIGHSASQSAFDAAIAEADVVYVSGQTSDTLLTGKLNAVTAGIVSENIRLRNELKLATDQQEDTESDFRIISNEHYITSSFGTGTLAIFTSAQPVGFLKGTLASGLMPLGETLNIGSVYEKSLATLDAGGLQTDDVPAAGRRVQLPWGESSFNFSALNANGLAIMRRAVEWAAGATEEVGNTVFGYDTEFSTEVTNVVGKQIATQAVLPVNGTVTKIWAFIKGKDKARVRYAIYTDNSGEPGTKIIESSKEKTNIGTYWMGIPVTSTPLTAGTYWLALSFNDNGEGYRHDSGSSGQTRYRTWNGCEDGYLASWGTSNDSFTIRITIWAEYTPN